MTAIFATFLLVALVCAGAIPFASERMRRRFKAALIVALLFAWAALGKAIAQIVARTASTLVTPGGARQPHLIEEAAREGLMLLAALGGPALVATALGWLALKMTRPDRKQPRS